MAYNWSNPVDFSSGFGADTQGQFKDITSFLPAKQGGNMLLAPLAAPLLTGLFSAGSSMFGANKAEEAARRSDNTSKQIAQAQLDAQRAGIEESRNLAKGNLGFGMFDKVFSAGTGADLDFGRQRNAAFLQAGPLASLEAANKRDDARAGLGMEGSLEAKELNQRQNRDRLKQILAEKRGGMEGIFGRIVSSEFV
tara:strand:+ start:4203 stop:4787 length:585 start_codon:yes stop_codon:yes gene_type:complete